MLVFLSVTRGSPGEFHVQPNRADAMREWGRRSLGFSGDWVSRLRTGPLPPPPPLPHGKNTPTPTPYTSSAIHAAPLATAPVAAAAANTNTTPTTSRHRRPPLFLTPTQHQHPHPHRPPALRSAGILRPRTTHPARSGAASPAPAPALATAPLPVRRSSSHGAGGPFIGPVPRSARRWARSAHLHEVRRVHAHHTTHTTQDGDVFTAAWGGNKGKSAPATAMVGTFFAKEAAVAEANGRMPASARPAAGGSLRVPLDATATTAAAWMWRPDADACASAVGAAETWVDTDTDAEVGSDGGLWENDGD